MIKHWLNQLTGKKSILILSSWYPTPEKPFLGNFVQHQARVLATKYDVTVLHTIARSDKKTIDLEERIENQLREVIVYFPQGSNFFTRKSNRIQAFKKGLEHIKKPDIVHGHIILPNVYLFKIAKDYFKVPLVITEHSSNFRSERRKNFSIVDRFLLRMARQTADKIVSVSGFLKKDLLNYFPEQKLVIIGNPVDTELFTPSDKANNDFTYFLHVSTLDKSTKNVEGILQAVHLLVQKGYEEVKLKIISDEPTEELIAQISGMGLNRYISVAGPLSPKELVPQFQSASAFVLFSNYESFSIVIAEAWSSGIPVIATNVGIADHMDENLGYNVKISDALGLAIAMEKVINDRHFDPSKVRAAAMRYSKENFLKEIGELYEQL